jgi:hypothetical protein
LCPHAAAECAPPQVDLAIVAAHEAGYVRTYIVLPSTIYAIASGPLFDAKIANAHSIQLPSLIRASAARGAAGTVGPGTNVWPNARPACFAALCTY